MTGDPAVDVARRLDDLVRSVTELLDVECVGLLLCDSGRRLRTVTASGPAALQLERAQEATGVGPGPDVHRTRALVAVPDVFTVAGYADLTPRLGGSGVRAVLSAPVFAADAVIGNLNAVDPWAHAWDDRQQAALQTFAALVADLLLLSATSRGERLAELADHLADHLADSPANSSTDLDGDLS